METLIHFFRDVGGPEGSGLVILIVFYIFCGWLVARFALVFGKPGVVVVGLFVFSLAIAPWIPQGQVTMKWVYLPHTWGVVAFIWTVWRRWKSDL